ncbi:cyclic nucleotide-binding domain-containing protein [Patescibacteria group bacterium]|nr:cyclic nucleotide-binding domain-containing protein [Patescibacteria group bacterium]
MKIKKNFINLSDPGVLEMFGGEEFWERTSLPAGQVALKEGDATQDFYYIVSGSVRVSKSMANGEERELAVLKEGDFFGENSLISASARTASITALADCELLKLSPDSFRRMVKKDAEASTGILLGIMQGLNSRIAVMNNRLLAVYEMTEILHEYRGDRQFMMQSVFARLSEVLECDTMVIFGMDGLPQFSHPNMGADKVMEIQMMVPDMASQLNMDDAPAYLIKKGTAFVSIHNLKGQIVAILTVELCDENNDKDLKFLMTIAEQIGHVIS